jgi:hypothetical protein
MRYHAFSVLIVDPFGSILHIAAACCFEHSSGMQVQGHKEELVGWRLCQGTIS